METHTGTTSHLKGTRANGDTHWDYISSKRYQSKWRHTLGLHLILKVPEQMEKHSGTTSHLKKVPEQMETHTGTTSHLKRYQSWVHATIL